MILSIFLSLVMTSLAISLLIIIFAFLSRAFPRLMSSLTRYTIWVLILFSLLLPFRPLMGNGLFVLEPPHIARQAAAGTAAAQPAAAEASTTAAGLPLIQLVLYGVLAVWLIGSAVYLTRHLMQYIKLRRLIQRVGQEVTDPDTLELFDNLMAYKGIENPRIKLVVCNFVKSPMLTGFRNPVVLLPEQTFSPQQLEVVLEHELTHYTHRDLFINLLMIITTSLHWFNPVVRFANQVIQEEGEILCDEAVLRGKNLDYRRFYGKTILSLIESGEPKTIALSTCFFESKGSLQHRLMAILDIHNPRKRLSYVTLLASLSLIILSGSVVVLATELAPAVQTIPAKKQPADQGQTGKSSSSASSGKPADSAAQKSSSEDSKADKSSQTASSSQAESGSQAAVSSSAATSAPAAAATVPSQTAPASAAPAASAGTTSGAVSSDDDNDDDDDDDGSSSSDTDDDDD